MMRKVVNAWFAIITVLLLSGVAVQAQVYDFEDYNIGDPIDAIGWGGMVAEVADDPLAPGNNVLKFTPNNYNAAPVLEFTLPSGKTLADYPTFTFKAYFAQGDVGWKDIIVEAYQTAPTAQAYNNPDVRIGSWNRATGASTAWEDITIDIAGSASFTGTIYIAFGINCAGEGGGATTIWYADDVDLGIEEGPVTQGYYIDDWGTIGGRWGGWRLEKGDSAGDVSMSGDGPPTGNWATVRGGFVEPLEITVDKAVIVRGKVEFVGDDLDTWGPIRYGFFHHDSAGTLQIDSTQATTGVDTTYYNMAWSGKETYAHGYMIAPRSGTNASISGWGSGGSGEVGAINGNWISSWSGRGLLHVLPAPARAKITEGTYEWAMSVQALGDGTNELRFYFQKVLASGEQQTSYWFGGVAIDDAPITSTINGFCFGKNPGNGAENTNITGYNLTEVQVDYGDPITVTEKPWQAYWVTDWGFSGGNLGGWDLTIGEFDGDVSIGGTAAPTGWSAVRGGFVEPYELTTVKDRALIITGKIELVGGGFEDLASFRYGIFYSDSAGKTIQDANLDSNWVWDGTDRAHSGYLFVPPSCANIASWSGMPGTWGAIANDTWWDIDGSNNFSLGTPLQDPPDAVAGAGTYDFAISISPHSIGNVIKTTLSKTDGSYYWETAAIIPVVATTNKFNCVAFAINSSTTTTMNLMEIQVDRGPHITTDVNDEEAKQLKQLPTVYSLKQNYPNPFNPKTTIEFGLPQNSEVKLVVYDLSGRVVAELANGNFDAGYHQIHFDATHLASGVYFVKIKAGDFVSVNKAMLVK